MYKGTIVALEWGGTSDCFSGTPVPLSNYYGYTNSLNCSRRITTTEGGLLQDLSDFHSIHTSDQKSI